MNAMNPVIAILTLTLLSLPSVGLASDAVFSPVTPEQVPPGTDYALTLPKPQSAQEAQSLRGKRVAILASHGVEEDEITYPHRYLTERGAEVEVVVPGWTAQGVVASKFLKPTLFVRGSRTFDQAKTEKYDLMVLTGGAWNAQVVRSDAQALALVRAHYSSGRPLAAICAGTSVLIDAGIAKGTRLTGSPVVRPDLINAGARFEDQAVVEQGNLVTSRNPYDLPQFSAALKRALIGE